MNGLSHTSLQAELFLVTDASDSHIGGVRQQKSADHWRPLGFLSRYSCLTAQPAAKPFLPSFSKYAAGPPAPPGATPPPPTPLMREKQGDSFQSNSIALYIYWQDSLLYMEHAVHGVLQYAVRWSRSGSRSVASSPHEHN